MSNKFDNCVKNINMKIRNGIIPRKYKCGKDSYCSSNAYALCRRIK